MAMSMMRSDLASVKRLKTPAWLVGSLARTAHSTPLITPMPVTMLPPSGLSVPHAASVDSSRKGVSRSTSR